MAKTEKTLRLILGDQLNINHSWFTTMDASVTYVLMELRSETDYAQHHIQKVIGFFASMQNFAKALQQKGHHVIYIYLNDKSNLQTFDKNCEALITTNHFTNFEYQLPDEYRLDEHFKSFTSKLKITSNVCDTEHFYSTRNELKDLFAGKKMYLMETFYRYMRKKHQVLLEDGDKPLNGKWNFDEDNRQKLPKAHKPTAPLLFVNDVSEIDKEIRNAGIKTIGTVELTQDAAGNSTLSGENYYWFFTGCMAVATVLLIPVLLLYKPREYLQGEPTNSRLAPDNAVGSLTGSRAKR